MDNRLSNSIKKKEEAFSKMKVSLPIQISAMAVNYFLKSFQTESWGGDKWADVKRHHKKAPKSDKSATSRKILIGKSGGTKGASHAHLRAAVSSSARTKLWDNISFAIALPYAKIQNEGGEVHIPPHSRVLGFKQKNGRGAYQFASAKKATSSQKVKIGSYTIHIKQRQFIGYSHALDRMIRDRINIEINKLAS